MSADGRPQAHEPRIDLETVRETLLLIEDDMRRVPRLERVAVALRQAVAEIAAAQAAADRARASDAAAVPRVVAFPSARPRFVPWSSGG